MSGGDVKKRKRIAVIGVSAILLVAMVVAVTVGVSSGKNSNDDLDDNQKNHVSSTMKAVKTLCYPTDYKKECEDSIMSEAEASNTSDPKELVKIAFNVTINKIAEKIKKTNLMQEVEKDPRAKAALDSCKQLMDLSIGEFTKSLETIREFSLTNIDEILESLKVWLSSTVTYQDTCLDGFENTTSNAGKKMKELLTNTMHLSSNALTIITQMADTVNDWNVTKLIGRRLLKEDDGLPSWAGVGVSRLLKESPIPLKPNATVALDGSGNFTSINEALKQVPEKNKKPYLIFIKAGVYREYVEIHKNMSHVVFVGEGGKKTRITGNKNFIDGVNTYRTATVGTCILLSLHRSIKLSLQFNNINVRLIIKLITAYSLLW